MAIVSVAKSTQVAVVGTEHSLTQQTGIGIYVLVVDTTGMEAGDALTIRVKTKHASGANLNVAYTETYSDVQVEKNKYTVPVPSDNEIACTIEQTAGTGRSYPWSLLRV